MPVKGFSRSVRKSGGKGLILRFLVWAGRKHAGWRSLAFPTVWLASLFAEVSGGGEAASLR